MEENSLIRIQTHYEAEQTPILTQEDGEKFLKAMKPVVESQEDLQYLFDNLQEIVYQVMDRTQFALDGRYKCRIQRSLENLSRLEKQIDSINNKLQTDPMIYQMEEEIEGFKTQISTMQRNNDILQQQKIQILRDNELDKQQILIDKSELKELNRNNLKLTFIMDEINKKLQSESQQPNQVTECIPENLPTITNQLSPRIPKNINILRNNIKNMKIQSSRIRKSQSQFVYINRNNEEIFSKCFKAAEYELLKSQKIIKSKQGLYGSLYFELVNRSKKEQMKTQAFTTQIQTPQKQFTPFQTKTPKDTIYETFKSMALTARDDYKQKELITLDVSYEEFKTFSPYQILGLLSLRPDVINQLHQFIFPNNFLMKQTVPLQLGGDGYKVAGERRLKDYLQIKEEQILNRMYNQYKPSQRINTIA